MDNFDIVRQFIREEGQEKGSISGEMALQSLKLIEDELEVTDRLLADRQRILEYIPPCQAHGGQCVPHAISWIKTVRDFLRLVNFSGVDHA